MQFKMIFLSLAGTLLALASLFFLYYTVRLIYINLTVAEIAARRSGGMLIGAIAFPLAAILFGFLSWFCFKKARISKRKL
jgi:hypothetical protein